MAAGKSARPSSDRDNPKRRQLISRTAPSIKPHGSKKCEQLPWRLQRRTTITAGGVRNAAIIRGTAVQRLEITATLDLRSQLVGGPAEHRRCAGRFALRPALDL